MSNQLVREGLGWTHSIGKPSLSRGPSPKSNSCDIRHDAGSCQQSQKHHSANKVRSIIIVVVSSPILERLREVSHLPNS